MRTHQKKREIIIEAKKLGHKTTQAIYDFGQRCIQSAGHTRVFDRINLLILNAFRLNSPDPLDTSLRQHAGVLPALLSILAALRTFFVDCTER